MRKTHEINGNFGYNSFWIFAQSLMGIDLLKSDFLLQIVYNRRNRSFIAVRSIQS